MEHGLFDEKLIRKNKTNSTATGKRRAIYLLAFKKNVSENSPFPGLKK